MASYSTQWSIKPVLHCLKRWLPTLRHIFLRSSCSSQREVGSIFLFRKLSLSCDLLWPTESRGRDVKWLLEVLWLPFSALLGHNFHVQNPELDHWILRGCEKRKKRPSQPLPSQLKHQTCAWGLWILWAQWSGANLRHMEQRPTFPRDCCPTEELWEIINGGAFRAWSFGWFVKQQQQLLKQGLRCPLCPLLLALWSPASCFPHFIPKHSQSSSPTELLALQQWVMVFFVSMSSHVLLFPECSSQLVSPTLIHPSRFGPHVMLSPLRSILCPLFPWDVSPLLLCHCSIMTVFTGKLVQCSLLCLQLGNAIQRK